MKIYVVSGSTGEYSDRSEWLVAAYTQQSDAQAHVLKATEYAEAWELRIKGLYEAGDYDGLVELDESKASPMDARFTHTYTGTTYHFQEIDLYERFTEAERTN